MTQALYVLLHWQLKCLSSVLPWWNCIGRSSLNWSGASRLRPADGDACASACQDTVSFVFERDAYNRCNQRLLLNCQLRCLSSAPLASTATLHCSLAHPHTPLVTHTVLFTPFSSLRENATVAGNSLLLCSFIFEWLTIISHSEKASREHRSRVLCWGLGWYTVSFSSIVVKWKVFRIIPNLWLAQALHALEEILVLWYAGCEESPSLWCTLRNGGNQHTSFFFVKWLLKFSWSYFNSSGLRSHWSGDCLSV